VLSAILDSFEQAVQDLRDPEDSDSYYSGKKKRFALKSKATVDSDTGNIARCAASKRSLHTTATIGDIIPLKHALLLDWLIGISSLVLKSDTAFTIRFSFLCT
jgi:hypothetical protein